MGGGWAAAVAAAAHQQCIGVQYDCGGSRFPLGIRVHKGLKVGRGVGLNEAVLLLGEPRHDGAAGGGGGRRRRRTATPQVLLASRQQAAMLLITSWLLLTLSRHHSVDGEPTGWLFSSHTVPECCLLVNFDALLLAT